MTAVVETKRIFRRNDPGTKREDWNRWSPVPFEEMDSSLNVQQWIQQVIAKDPSNIDLILGAPTDVDEGVWKYEQLRQVCLELNGLALQLQEECHPESCLQMTATDQWIFLCANHKNPKECSAIDYTRHTLDGAAALLNNSKYFPSRINIKESSISKLGSVCRRVYRIFSHAYYHHRPIFDEFEKSTSLCLRLNKRMTAVQSVISSSESALECLARLGCIGLRLNEKGLDRVVSPHLLPFKTLELAGDMSTGKTLMCYTLVVEMLAANIEDIVVWLDSNASFRPATLIQIYERRTGRSADADGILDRVLIHLVLDEETLIVTLQMLKSLKDSFSKRIPLVIIDSVAGMMEESSWSLSKGGLKKQERVAQLLGEVKKILEATIVITNLVVLSNDQLRAALGKFWNKTIANRILMQRMENNRLRASVFPGSRAAVGDCADFKLGVFGVADYAS